ncbi:MAG: DinB family protein [Planctomycetota bacterium]
MRPSSPEDKTSPLLASRRPDASDLTEDYHIGLVNRLEGDCAMKLLSSHLHWLCELASSLSTEQVDRVHAPYAWTIRQVIEHCADAERVFGDRMLRIAAGDETNLPAWDENAYAEARFGLGNFGHLISELGYLREANVLLLRRINPTLWGNVGKVDGRPISVRGIAWVCAGHLHHHLEVIEKRCGVSVERKP